MRVIKARICRWVEGICSALPDDIIYRLRNFLVRLSALIEDLEQGYRVPKEVVPHYFNVECVRMSCCGFTFSAEHLDSSGTTYTCPACHPGR